MSKLIKSYFSTAAIYELRPGNGSVFFNVTPHGHDKRLAYYVEHGIDVEPVPTFESYLANFLPESAKANVSNDPPSRPGIALMEQLKSYRLDGTYKPRSTERGCRPNY